MASPTRIGNVNRRPDLCLHNCPKECADQITNLLSRELGIEGFELLDRSTNGGKANHFHIRFASDPKFPSEKVVGILQKFPAVKARLTA